jgi:hypothetical protein
MVSQMTVTTIQKVFAPIKRLLPRAIHSPLRAVATGVVTPIRFSRQTGHWKSSLRQAACAANGTPIPWYTYPAIDFLQQRRFDDKNILEFGAGQSTLWWSRHARSVFAIEEDKLWFEHLRPELGANVTIHHVPVDHATRTIQPIKELIDRSGIGQFDVIIVDGHLRRELTALAFDYLAPSGAMILDNSEGYGFYDEIRARSCRRIDFFGFAPGVSLRHCTSVVFVSDCFLLWPDIPIPVIEAAHA